MRTGPLSRFTILDASRVRAGPTAMRTFADLGARVIKSLDRGAIARLHEQGAV